MRKKVSVLLIVVATGSVSMLFQNCSPGFEIDSSFDLGSSSVTSASKLRRTSNVEYKNSLTDAVRNQFLRRSTNPDMYFFTDSSVIKSALSALPVDQVETKLGTDQLSSSLTSSRFSAYLDISVGTAQEIAANSGRLQAFAGACASSALDISNAVCVDTFVNEFATIAFRTPPTVDEVSDIKSGAPNWVSLIGRILMHPRFIAHIERDGLRDAAGTYTLTDYEIEARLTATFWKSLPDLTGLAAVKSGQLKTPAGLQTEINRILDSQKARDTLWVFYQQWLALSRLPSGAYSTGPKYEAFASPYVAAQLDQNFKNAVLEDGQQFLEYLTWTQKSKLEDLFRSPLIMTTNPLVASIYGVAPRANTAALPVMDPTGNFRGLLTRPFITQQKPSVDGETNHILRGVFLLQNILGFKMGAPADFADQQAAAIQVPPGSSTRQQVALKTGMAACISCHSQINPAGFALAHFDALGRYRTIEKRYSVVNNVVTETASNIVDSATSLPIGGRSYQITNASSLTDALVQSGQLFEGFADYYFKFAFGRKPEGTADRAVINALKLGLKTKSIRDALEGMATAKEFALAQPPGGA